MGANRDSLFYPTRRLCNRAPVITGTQEGSGAGTAGFDLGHHRRLSSPTRGRLT